VSWPPVSDLRDLAICATRCGDLNKARQACLKALETVPEDGLTQGILGEILFELGEQEQAIEHLVLATQQAPEQTHPWLSLADYYNRIDQKDKAIETLKIATNTAENEPTIHLALAKLFLEDRAFTQAESSLNRAYAVINDQEISRVTDHTNSRISPIHKGGYPDPDIQSSIVYLYGLTLYQLGHLERATQILSERYLVHSSFPGLAYTYGRMLLEANEFRKAIPPLAVAVAKEPKIPGPYIDYAYTLLRVKEQPDLAVTNLIKAIIILDEQTSTDEDTGFVAQSNQDRIIPAIFSDNPDWKYGITTRISTFDEPDHRNSERTRVLAIALLAEAYETANQYDLALRFYSQALETTLSLNEAWKSRLATGMARVALLMNQPEIAIAVLQEISRKETAEVEVYKILCEAFGEIELFDEAMEAGLKAIELAPDNVGILSWFSKKALEMGALDSAFPALLRAVEIDPRRVDLAVELANIFIKLGKGSDAHEILLKVIDNPNSKPEDLFQAACGFDNLGDVKNSIDSLERALTLQPEPPVDILIALFSAYHRSGNYELALKTLDLALDQNNELPKLHSCKADILRELGRFQAAQACLEHAIKLAPQDPENYFSLAKLLISRRDLIEAQKYTQKLIELIDFRQISEFTIKATELAAGLAQSMLEIEAAHELVSLINIELIPFEKIIEEIPEDLIVDYLCLKTELELELNEEVLSGPSIDYITKLPPNLPRVQAIQSRIANRQGDSSSARNFYSSSLERITPLQESETNNSFLPLLGVSLAALDLGDFEKAIEILLNINEVRSNPYTHTQFARAISLRCEHQRLCKSLDVINNVPVSKSDPEEEYQLALASLQSATDGLSIDNIGSLPTLIRKWRARCQAVFHPGPEAIELFNRYPLNHSDQAALIFTLAQLGDLESITNNFNEIRNKAAISQINHSILAQFAHAIGLKGRRQNDLFESLNAMQAAINQKSDEPLYYAIYARLAQLNGDLKLASEAVQTALTYWPNEPRWHGMTANFALALDDLPLAISHLDQAINLEPQHVEHYLVLGEAHLKVGNPDQAVNALHQALEINPKQYEAYLALASAQIACGRLSEAAKNAEIAISLAPDELPPLLLSAEIYLTLGEPEQAKRYAESGIKLKPDDPSAHHFLARALNALGRTSESLEVIDKVLPFASDPIPLLLERAKLIGNVEGEEAAKTALEQLTNQYPDEPVVLAEFAKIFANSGKQEDAIRAAQRALRSGNGHLSMDDRAQLHYLLGNLFMKTGQLDQAVHQLSEASRLSPNNLQTYLDLAGVLQDRRQHGRAIEVYRKAISIAPSDPRPYHQIGLVLRECHDYQGAETMLRRAAELAPKEITIHRQLAALIALNLVHNSQN
jgi:tetratricopeptide (TPR) repeat protein